MRHDPKKEFGIRLKAARIKAGYPSAQQFAIHLEEAPHCYRNWEAGKAMPRTLKLVKVCGELKINPDDLLLGLDKAG